MRSVRLMARESRTSTLLAPGLVKVLRPTPGKRARPPSPRTPDVVPTGDGLPGLPLIKPEYGRPSASVTILEIWKPSTTRFRDLFWMLWVGSSQTPDKVKRLRWSKSDNE